MFNNLKNLDQSYEINCEKILLINLAGRKIGTFDQAKETECILLISNTNLKYLINKFLIFYGLIIYFSL